MSHEQEQMRLDISGLIDQIDKHHWLNVHFRAFQMAADAWKLHVLANARTGARESNSPAGAVLDSERDPAAAPIKDDTPPGIDRLDIVSGRLDDIYEKAIRENDLKTALEAVIAGRAFFR